MSKQVHQTEDFNTMLSAKAGFLPSEADAETIAHDIHLNERLRAGDEAAFASLLDKHSSLMFRIAMTYIPNRAIAEEIVQEAWLGVLRSIARFEGRCSLKTWIFRILTNIAKTRSQREGRSIPFSSLTYRDEEESNLSISHERLLLPGNMHTEHWLSFPHSWGENPEKKLLSQEVQACLQHAIQTLLPRQRAVITLRDIEGRTASEVCALLRISEANQRVLLHRARTHVRQALERYFHEEERWQ